MTEMTDPTTDATGAKTPEEWRAATEKAKTLAEALPWLKQYHGKTIVVKYGGNAMTDESLKKAFAEDIVFLRYAGFRPEIGRASCRERVYCMSCRSRWSPYHSSRRRHTRS